MQQKVSSLFHLFSKRQFLRAFLQIRGTEGEKVTPQVMVNNPFLPLKKVLFEFLILHFSLEELNLARERRSVTVGERDKDNFYPTKSIPMSSGPNSPSTISAHKNGTFKKIKDLPKKFTGSIQVINNNVRVESLLFHYFFLKTVEIHF